MLDDPRQLPHTDDTSRPAPPRLVDTFAGRVLVQGAAMLSVAALVVQFADHRSTETESRLDALEDQLALVRHERDRMQRLSEALTTELNEAAIETEIVRWQLSYTEERYARLEQSSTSRVRESRREATRSATHSTPQPGPPAQFESLDPAEGPPPDAPLDVARLDPAVAVLAAAAIPSAVTDVPSVHGLRPHRSLALERLDESRMPDTMRRVDGQLDRDRAFGIWQSVMDESADRECARRSGAAARRCRDGVKRTLFPMGTRAVECILNGNASADYVSGIPLDQLPTHSVPLEHGAVILCDRGLQNL